MNKHEEVLVIDSRELEVDLMMVVEDLTILCKSRENLNGKLKVKTRMKRKVVIPTEVVLVPIEEEVILTLEVDFMVNVIDVVVKVIDPLNIKVMVRMLVRML